METSLLMLDALAVVVLVFTSLRNDRLSERQQQTGPFRFAVGRRKAEADGAGHRTGGRDGPEPQSR